MGKTIRKEAPARGREQRRPFLNRTELLVWRRRGPREGRTADRSRPAAHGPAWVKADVDMTCRRRSRGSWQVAGNIAGIFRYGLLLMRFETALLEGGVNGANL